MHIFIDESGLFLPLDGTKEKWSCVSALAVPSATVHKLMADFIRVRHQFDGCDAEIKGASMTERQVARVLTLLRSHAVVVEACAIDMGNHVAADVQAMREAQAAKLFEHVTPEHQPTLVANLKALAADIRRLPDQLFVQVILIIELIERLLETMTLYYVQRLPHELGEFHWIVDQKDPAGLTPSEKVWKTLVLPALQERSRKRPMMMLEGADYSHFDRYTFPLPADVDGPSRFGTDSRRLLQEDLRFSTSESEPGLQLADIVAAALTRGLNGTLQPSGWQQLGNLMIRKKNDTPHFVMVTSNSNAAGPKITFNPRASAVRKILTARARPLLLRRGSRTAG